MHFEDEYEDVWEDEDVMDEEEEENSEDYESIDDENDNGEEMIMENKQNKKYKLKEKKNQAEENTQKSMPYIGTGQNLASDEFLDFENRTYDMIHRSTTEWPCMSIDFLLPDLPIGNVMSCRNTPVVEQWQYPIEAYAVAGSMAS